MRSKASRRIVRYSRPAWVMIRRWRSRLKSLTPSSASRALTWWLTAPWVTNSSSAARVKLSWRAKALRAFNGGRRRSISELHEENSGKVEKRCFAGNRFLVLLVNSVADALSGRCLKPEHLQMPTQMAAVPRMGPSVIAKLHSIASGPVRIFAMWCVRSAERRALRELAEDRHRLSDIGLSREQALRESEKLFWRP